MNYIQNDRGEYVPAVGAEGSDARLAAEWPQLIESLAREIEEGNSLPALDEMIDATGVTEKEADALLAIAKALAWEAE